MLYAFAIEPDVLVTWDKCRNTLNLMGFEHGRAIAAYPSRKKWKELARNACRNNVELTDKHRKRIFRHIELSNAKFVLSSSDYDKAVLPVSERWIRNAIATQTAAREFHAILSTCNPVDHPDVVLEEDIDGTHPLLAVPREASVLREPRALIEHIGTLVRSSSSVCLVDPHFDPVEERWRPVVGACVELAGKTLRGAAHVTIHTRATYKRATATIPSFKDFELGCRPHVQGMLSGRVKSIRVCRWRIPADSHHDFHARYVLTDRGGYRLDKGLDEQPGVEQSVELLSDGTWRRLRDGFGDANPFFDLDGEFTVQPPPPAA